MSTKSETDDRPRKKKKKKPGGAGLWIGLAIGGGVLLLIAIVAVVVIVVAPWNRLGGDKKPDVAQNDPPRPGKLGGEVVKEPKSLLGNIRRRADEIVRDAEMDGILTLFVAYCEDNKNPNTRSLDKFLESNRTAPSKTVNAIKTNEYKLNLRARPFSDDIVVFEGEPYTDGYFCMRADKTKGYVSAQDMKAAGLIQ